MPGKINQHVFETFIREKCGYNRQEVNAGPGFGVDTAIIDLPGDMALAAASDPASLIPSLGLAESAWLTVCLAANDIATTGFPPMYAQFVLNLPEGFADLKIYWEYIHTYCRDMGIAITGGHTGFVPGQDSTISGAVTLFTVAPKKDILVSRYARPGDIVLATKQCAISTAAILAKSFPETVKNKLGRYVYEEGCKLFESISSLTDALAAAGKETRHPEVTAMHDVTEGGVLGAVYELAAASGCGALIHNRKLPSGDVQEAICSLFGVDQRYVIGAGSMIITVKNGEQHKVISRLRKAGTDCTEIGVLREAGEGIKLVEGDKVQDLNYLDRDPYWSAFYEALKKGWK